MPFDWVRGRGNAEYADTLATLLENGFKGWCKFETLVPIPPELDRPKATDPLEVRAWDKELEIGFYHDFRFNIFGEGGREYYEGIAARYRRRIERLYEMLGRASKVLAVVVFPDEPASEEVARKLKARSAASTRGCSCAISRGTSTRTTTCARR